ncbi:MOSC domain-containing protein [Pelagicoccus mobilis]|uniref:MOSC domain-containing protein n=1 Tax=Pelagicoccus mobilis TaxID=415221 RepID=A0A934S1T4_9BACT|nr:MOSC domain-containing protein [Pelagicoccus mobilis]MBK1879600.1 hypothetical protein [Pelagicoccus mobilis]
MSFITKEEFVERLDYVKAAPKEEGSLKLIVVRPVSNEREMPASCSLSVEEGVAGDHWAKGCWKSLPDGSPDPAVQIAMMNYRVLELIADSDERRALAGDALCVDFDLCDENLSTGDRLRIGETEVEVTDVPHNGCAKFAERFGKEALAYINSAEGKALHLRGIYVKVVSDGVVSVGDAVKRLG